MVFIRLGGLIAWLALIFGVLRAGTGLYVAFTADTPAALAAMSARYLGSATSGEAIDQGISTLVFGVALGILAQIGKALVAPKALQSE